MKEHHEPMDINKDFEHDMRTLIKRLGISCQFELSELCGKHLPHLFQEDGSVKPNSVFGDVILNITRGFIMINFQLLYDMENPKIKERLIEYMDAIKMQCLSEIDLIQKAVN